jgi:multidrug resistance efflux pump
MADVSADTAVDPSPPAAETKPPPPASNIRKLTIIVLLTTVVLYVYVLFADRLTPYTDQASVQAYVVTMAPDISGRVTTVNAVDNQSVTAGKVLFTIDPERYQIAVETAEAQLAAAGQSVGSSTASLVAAEARLAVSEANLANSKQQTERVFEMVKAGVRRRADGDEARAALNSSVADVERARAEVEATRQALGPVGADNPQIRQAQAALRKARRDLVDTVVRAPSSGAVTNLQLATGRFIGAGQTALTFIDSEATWIESELRENALEYIRVGNPVGVTLDVLPGRVYPGRVESIGWAVDNNDVDPTTGLPVISNDTGWVREPQRFVVRVRLDPDKAPKNVRVGSQASVVVYTQRSGITDAIGRLWIAVVAYFSYLN